MTKLATLLFLISTSAFSYVPTVESLFRNGSNEDVTANGVSVTFNVKKLQAISSKPTGIQDITLLSENKTDDYYKIYFSKLNNDLLKVAQTRYDDATYSEASLLEKTYFSNFTPYSIRANSEESEKGILLGLIFSLVFNDGNFLISYLKSLGVPVRHNSDLINREKVEVLAAYKQYLMLINKDRAAKKTAQNPLRPGDPSAREKVDRIMNESMYYDTKQVKLSREDGVMSWLVSAGPFEAVVSYKEREIQKIRFKSQLGELEIVCKDYRLANGTHKLPRKILLRDYKGETFQIELTQLRHYNEREEYIIRRLKKWDELLTGKDSTYSKPAFLL